MKFIGNPPYLPSSKQTFLDWVEDFANQLDVSEELPSSFEINNDSEFFKRLGAWETQMLIYNRMILACKMERMRLEMENK